MLLSPFALRGLKVRFFALHHRANAQGGVSASDGGRQDLGGDEQASDGAEEAHDRWGRSSRSVRRVRTRARGATGEERVTRTTTT